MTNVVWLPIKPIIHIANVWRQILPSAWEENVWEKSVRSPTNFLSVTIVFKNDSLADVVGSISVDFEI